MNEYENTYLPLLVINQPKQRRVTGEPDQVAVTLHSNHIHSLSNRALHVGPFNADSSVFANHVKVAPVCVVEKAE